jgi:hypothetical protein
LTENVINHKAAVADLVPAAPGRLDPPFHFALGEAFPAAVILPGGFRSCEGSSA